MKRIAPTTMVILIVFAALLPRDLAALERDIPKATWEPIFFESINSLSIRAGWAPLRELSLPPDSLEVRVWIGFGLGPLKGLTVRRDGSSWAGSYVTEQRRRSASADVRSVHPRSQWHALWAKLVQLGLLTLPDSSQLPGHEDVADGVSYVVEINADGRYRTYMYSNPRYQKWPEAKQIIEIVHMLEYELLPKP